jgi:hypothetical protein
LLYWALFWTSVACGAGFLGPKRSSPQHLLTFSEHFSLYKNKAFLKTLTKRFTFQNTKIKNIYIFLIKFKTLSKKQNTVGFKKTFHFLVGDALRKQVFIFVGVETNYYFQKNKNKKCGLTATPNDG